MNNQMVSRLEDKSLILEREIATPERIVYADYFCDAEGNVAEDLPERW